MAIFDNPLIIIQSGGGVLDLSNIEQVLSIPTEPTSSDSSIIECNNIKYVLSENGILLDSESMLFENIEVTKWESDNTMTRYEYSATITLSNEVTSDMLYNIIYEQNDYRIGNYSEIATLNNGSITIYSKTNAIVTIVAIIISY